MVIVGPRAIHDDVYTYTPLAEKPKNTLFTYEEPKPPTKLKDLSKIIGDGPSKYIDLRQVFVEGLKSKGFDFGKSLANFRNSGPISSTDGSESLVNLGESIGALQN